MAQDDDFWDDSSDDEGEGTHGAPSISSHPNTPNTDDRTPYDRTYGNNVDEEQVSAPVSPQSGASTSSSAQKQSPFPGATWSSQSSETSGGGGSQSAQKHRGWIVALVAVILLFIVVIFGISSCTNLIGSFLSPSSYEEGSSVNALDANTVGIIELTGSIEYDGSTCSPEGFKEQLDKAADDSSIKAVVIRVDSGGGTSAAGEEMTHYLRDFMASSGKPVVVSSASMNASAAYMITSQADYIYTLESTSIGSIGTAMQFTDLSGLYELLGIDIDTITSADGKDSTYSTRPLDDDERAYYQDMVDQINEEFIEAVATGRGMNISEVRDLATGLTFTGIDAVDNGLADELGTLDDAVAKACEMADLSSCSVEYLESSSSSIYNLLDLLGASASSDEETVSGGLGSSVDLER